MSTTTIALDALAPLTGAELALSGWFEVGQARIDAFADATDDHQWIHNDPERCRRESPWGRPVAHGFLTLALLPAMLSEAIAIDGMRIGVNYGLDKVRFPAPLPAGSRVRARWTLRRAEPVAGGWQLAWQATVEAEGQPKPVCVAEFLFRAYA
jgi:acyl dehydratase